MGENCFSRSRDHCAANWCTNFNCSLGFYLPGCAAPLYVSLRSGFVVLTTKPGDPRQGFIQPVVRSFAPLTPKGASKMLRATGHARMVSYIRVRVWGWVRVRVLSYGFGVRGREVRSRDCALASDS